MVGLILNSAVVTATSYAIQASFFSIKNTGAGTITVTTGYPADTPPAGVTYGSFTIAAGDPPFCWGIAGVGILQQITINATATVAEVVWSS